jgi:hypothetical protein
MLKRQKNAQLVDLDRFLRPIRVSLAFAVIAVQLVLPIAPVFADEIVPEPVLQVSESAPQEETPVTPVSSVTESASVSIESQSEITETEQVANSNDVVEPSLDSEIVIHDDAPISSENEDTEVVTPTSTISNGENPGHGSGGDTSSSSEPEALTDIEVPTENQDTGEITEEDSVINAATSSTTVTEEEAVPHDDAQEPIVEENLAELPVSNTEPDTVVEETSTTQADATTTEATTTQNLIQPATSMFVNDENRFSFGVDECARVADGSFYCSKEDVNEKVFSDRIFAGPDIDGDSEIYIEKEGILTQLTHNLQDDVAPYYDENSESIVWHRLVDARYQIVSLDLETGEEIQLTHDSYNNMQPTRNGDLTVWQGWVGNDWEIIMSKDGEITMLTDNATHDVGPRINGEYIIWQSEELTGWKVKIYNINTKQIETISDTEGASVENPRLVLVYDAKHDNGDVETRGYDLITGESVPLTQQAPVLPEELPDPDQTGEERALITTITQLKTKTDDEDNDSEPVSVGPPLDSSTSTPDVVVPPLQISTTTVAVQEASSTLPSTIPDLIVGIQNASSTAEIEHIPDLVVTEFIPQTTVDSDSQIEVATTT